MLGAQVQFLKFLTLIPGVTGLLSPIHGDAYVSCTADYQFVCSLQFIAQLTTGVDTGYQNILLILVSKAHSYIGLGQSKQAIHTNHGMEFPKNSSEYVL